MNEKLRRLSISRRDFLKDALILGGAAAVFSRIEKFSPEWFREKEETAQRVQYEEIPRRQWLYREQVMASLHDCRSLYDKFLEKLPEIPSGQDLRPEALVLRRTLIKFFTGGLFTFEFTENERKVLADYLNDDVTGKGGEEREGKILGLVETGGLGGLELYKRVLIELSGRFGSGEVLRMESETVQSILSDTRAATLEVYDRSFETGVDFNSITPELLLKKGEERFFAYLTEKLLVDENDATEYTHRFITATELNFGQVKERFLADVPLPFTYELLPGMMAV